MPEVGNSDHNYLIARNRYYVKYPVFIRVSAVLVSGGNRQTLLCAERAGIVQISSDGIETEVGF